MGTIRRKENVRTHCPLYPTRPFRAEEASFEPDAEPVHPRQERAWWLWRKGRLLPQRRHQDHQLFPPSVLIDLSLEGPRMSVASGSGHGSVSPAPSYDLSIAGL